MCGVRVLGRDVTVDCEGVLLVNFSLDCECSIGLENELYSFPGKMKRW